MGREDDPERVPSRVAICVRRLSSPFVHPAEAPPGSDVQSPAGPAVPHPRRRPWLLSSRRSVVAASRSLSWPSRPFCSPRRSPMRARGRGVAAAEGGNPRSAGAAGAEAGSRPAGRPGGPPAGRRRDRAGAAVGLRSVRADRPPAVPPPAGRRTAPAAPPAAPRTAPAGRPAAPRTGRAARAAAPGTSRAGRPDGRPTAPRRPAARRTARRTRGTTRAAPPRRRRRAGCRTASSPPVRPRVRASGTPARGGRSPRRRSVRR